eukprot:m.17025 g.17025  ORF g.17025 m.17025 type:complete len:55 (-) comp8204_c0_seq1:104-268(-)
MNEWMETEMIDGEMEIEMDRTGMTTLCRSGCVESSGQRFLTHQMSPYERVKEQG